MGFLSGTICFERFRVDGPKIKQFSPKHVEILDRFAIGKLFSAEGFGTEEEWKKITGEGDLIRDIAPEADSLEGYLFPDTYKFDPGTPATTIVQAMVTNFRKHWGNEIALIRCSV